jgi:hypothetical protein
MIPTGIRLDLYDASQAMDRRLLRTAHNASLLGRAEECASLDDLVDSSR